jgi:hypothetical protein
MFNTEQNISQQPQNRSKKAVLANGMALANKVIVKKGITHKELTLILGVVVALVVALMFARSSSEENKTGISSGKMHIISIPGNSGKMIQSAIEILF